MPDRLDFQAERDRDGDSWDRADPVNGTIARLSWDWWAVFLPDGDRPHVVQLRHDADGYRGRCECKGYEFQSGPCAHLCTIRKAAFLGVEDAVDEVVRVPDAAERHDQHVEEAVAATDGGERR